MRRNVGWFLVVIVLFSAAILSAQTAAQPSQPAPQGDTTPIITLGQSPVPLNGPWKFQIGTSPIDIRTGK